MSQKNSKRSYTCGTDCMACLGTPETVIDDFTFDDPFIGRYGERANPLFGVRMGFEGYPDRDRRMALNQLRACEEEYKTVKEILPAGDSEVCLAGSCLAKAYRDYGKFEQERTVLSELLEQIRPKRKKTDKETLGRYYRVLSDYAWACLRTFRLSEAVEAFEKMGGGTPFIAVGSTLSGLAHAYGRMGDYAKAAGYFFKDYEYKLKEYARKDEAYGSLHQYAYVCANYLEDPDCASVAYRMICDFHLGELKSAIAENNTNLKYFALHCFEYLVAASETFESYGRFEDAVGYLGEALGVAEQIGSRSWSDFLKKRIKRVKIKSGLKPKTYA